MNPKVSIIVPIYNAQEKLRRCIESILKQDFTNFELLLLNDGSKDNTYEVMKNIKEGGHFLTSSH